MLHEFLIANREQLICLCGEKGAARRAPEAADAELPHGMRQFIQQVIDTLRLEAGRVSSSEHGHISDFLEVPHAHALGEIDAAAATHGSELLAHGSSVDQIVHGYGDLCQAITELAWSRSVPISTGDFRTLNRCLDNAIAGAVTEYLHQRDLAVSREDAEAMHERLGCLADELRAQVDCALEAVAAIKSGAVGTGGATGAALDGSLARLREIIDRSLAEIRLSAGMTAHPERIALADLIAEIRVVGTHEAMAKGCTLEVDDVDEELAVRADRALLSSALGHLLRNAFKRTPPNGAVLLRTRATVTRVGIEVEDQCGGLPLEEANLLCRPFEHRSANRSRLSMEHASSLRAAEAAGGRFRLHNSPGRGCVFAIELPRQC